MDAVCPLKVVACPGDDLQGAVTVKESGLF
jgi:hypothetical protein